MSGLLWGSLALLGAVYWEQTHTCLLFPAPTNGQRPSSREETFSSSTRSQLPAVGGGNPSSRFGLTSQEGWHPAFSVSAKRPFGNVNQRQKGGRLGENQGGVRGAQPAQDMASSAWDDSTAKHLFPGKTSTSALSHNSIGSFNYTLDWLSLSASLI